MVRPLLLLLFTGLFRLSAVRFDSRVLVLLGTIVSALCCGVILGLIARKMRRLGGGVSTAEGATTGGATAGGVTTGEAATPGGATTGAASPDAPDERYGSKTTYFFIISLLNLLGTKVTMLILPLFAAESEVGVFNIAYRFADLLIFPFFLMHSVLPQLFARHSQAEKEYTRSLFNESTRLMTLISLPLLLVNIFAGHFLLRLFGPAFDNGYGALVLISIAQFLFSLFGPANTILMMQGREKYSAYCLGVYVVILVGCSWWLLPVAGITGGAIAILISSVVYNGLLNGITWRFYGICTPFLTFRRKGE
jgi:hypothetical protein